MLAIEIPNAQLIDAMAEGNTMAVTLNLPAAYGQVLEPLFAASIKKHNRYLDVRIGLPRKPRSTGRFSQNNHFWGHARQIAKGNGDDVDWVAFWILVRAEKRGYPVHRDKMGNPHPAKWSEASTVEASAAIEQAHEDAAFCGVRLEEKGEW